jgi:hypothetical protein
MSTKGLIAGGLLFSFFAVAVNAQATSLIALNCESDVAFTLMEDMSKGTVSMSDGGSVGVFPMKKLSTQNGITEYEAPMSMSKLTIKISSPKNMGGFNVYAVTVEMTSEEGRKSQKLECTSH